jgi:hypothetical protein
MAIAINSTAVSSQPTTSSATRTIAFTNTSGTFLVIGISRFRNVATSSITYNGVSMTNAVSSVDASFYRSEIWYLANPSVGSNNFVITFASATDDGVVAGMVSLTGVNNASPIGATANQVSATNSTTPSINITTTFNNSYIFDCFYRNLSTTDVATAPQSEVWGQNDLYGTEGGGGSYKSFPTAGATSMSWTLGASGLWIMSAIELKQGSSGLPPRPIRNPTSGVMYFGLN